MKEEILNLSSLIKRCNCKGCGSTKYIDGCCKYCRTQNKEFQQLISSLLKVIQFCELDEEILLSLSDISYLNILEINQILDKYKFGNFLNNKFIEINNAIVNEEYRNEDLKYLLYFIENNFYTQENIMYISNFLMKNLFCNKVDASIDELLKIIVVYTENIMKAVHPNVRNPKCILEELEKDVAGDSFYDIIHLDKNYLINELQNNNYYEIVSTIFHECTHTFQHHIINSNELISYMILLIAKENVIRSKIPNYYSENYLKYASEVDARWGQNILLLQFIENNKLNVSEEMKTKINHSIDFEGQLVLDETRKINGQMTDVDTLFESLNLDVGVLNQYPILRFQYKDVGDKIQLKSKEELINEYNSYLNGEVSINSEKALMDYLYKNLINKADLTENLKR